MKKYYRKTALLLMAGLLGGQAVAGPEEPAGSPRGVRGKVVDARTGERLIGACVFVKGQQPAHPAPRTVHQAQQPQREPHRRGAPRRRPARTQGTPRAELPPRRALQALSTGAERLETGPQFSSLAPERQVGLHFRREAVRLRPHLNCGRIRPSRSFVVLLQRKKNTY